MGERRHVARLGGVCCVRVCTAICAALFRDGVLGFACASPYSVGLRILRGMPAPTTPLPQMACGSWQRRWATGRPRVFGPDFVEFHCAMLSRVYKDWLQNITRDTLAHRIVMALCPLAAPGAQADIKYHVWRFDAQAETAEAVAAAARDIVESSNLHRAAAAYCLDVTVEVIACRHCSAAEEARILATGVVSASQQWPAVEAALASQVAVPWEDAVASFLLAFKRENGNTRCECSKQIGLSLFASSAMTQGPSYQNGPVMHNMFNTLASNYTIYRENSHSTCFQVLNRFTAKKRM